MDRCKIFPVVKSLANTYETISSCCGFSTWQWSIEQTSFLHIYLHQQSLFASFFLFLYELFSIFITYVQALRILLLDLILIFSKLEVTKIQVKCMEYIKERAHVTSCIGKSSVLIFSHCYLLMKQYFFSK